MKILPILVILVVLIQSCCTPHKKIDLTEASELVQLDSEDLANFSRLKQQLIIDSAEIRKQNDETTAPSNRTSWMVTNSYYLNKIDSSRYTSLFATLKGKLVDAIQFNRNGSVIFTIKENVQINVGDYHDRYNHQLISADCNCPISTVYGNVDSVYVDSVINESWRYTFYKVLTGH